MKTIIIALCVCLLSGCASLRGTYQGEHLVIPFIEELKKWQLFQKDDDTFRSNMWQKPGERWADTYAVSIYYKKNINLATERAKMDLPGQQGCQGFSSSTLNHPKQTDMDSLFWQTRCEINGVVVARLLHLMIQGDESYYQIQKVWKTDVSDAEFSAWVQRFQNTYICHQGAEQSTCPN